MVFSLSLKGQIYFIVLETKPNNTDIFQIVQRVQIILEVTVWKEIHFSTATCSCTLIDLVRGNTFAQILFCLWSVMCCDSVLRSDFQSGWVTRPKPDKATIKEQQNLPRLSLFLFLYVRTREADVLNLKCKYLKHTIFLHLTLAV